MAQQAADGHGGQQFYRHGEWLAHWQVRELLGGGGFGQAYRVRDRQSNEFVLKVSRNDDKIFAAKHEATIMLSYGNHEGLPRLYETWEEADWTFLVMEYIQGEDLSQLLQRLGRPLSEERVVELLSQMFDILEYLHGKGVIHLDLKPAQFVRSNTGRLVLIDYGLSQRFHGQPLSLGYCAGTPAYMAPEQYSIEPTVDARTDVYGLGATVHTLLTGQVQKPFHPVPRLAGSKRFHPRLVEAIDRATAYEPRDRFASAKEFAGFLFEEE